MILGLLTALFWGGADFLIKLLGDRMSLRDSLVWTQGTAALIVVGAILLERRVPFATLDMHVVPMFAAGAVSSAIALGLLFIAFQNGRVAVVAPLVGSYAIVATLLGLATGTEPGSLPLLLTLGFISLGALLVMLEKGEGGLKPGAGAAAAIGSALGSGFSIWIMATYVLPTVPVSDALLVNFGFPCLAALLWPARRRLASPQGRTGWSIVLGIGIVSAAGYGCYNNGLLDGGIAIVSVLATLSSAVTILLARLLIKERVRGVQRVGLAIVLLGLPVLAAVRGGG
jgi:drug/metabolite transporter (DMT)-like permease